MFPCKAGCHSLSIPVPFPAGTVPVPYCTCIVTKPYTHTHTHTHCTTSFVFSSRTGTGTVPVTGTVPETVVTVSVLSLFLRLPSPSGSIWGSTAVYRTRKYRYSIECRVCASHSFHFANIKIREIYSLIPFHYALYIILIGNAHNLFSNVTSTNLCIKQQS